MEMSEMPSPPVQKGSKRDEVHEDLINEMWSEYLKNVDGYDKGVTESWKEDANGVLVFTGLFSAVVASFIIESYKLLSPDPGDQTVFHLSQLSQQFAGFANGTNVQPKPYSSSPPSTSIVCVNALWLLSLLLSTTCALFATLMQQWARIYIELSQSPSVAKDRARVRSFLFLGTQKYLMRVAVEATPTLLHLSVFLFYIGLVILFFTIFKTVAAVILIAVGLFGLAYFVLTVLPCIDHSSPYRTPMSSPCWYLWHASISYIARFIRLFTRLLHHCFVPPNLGDVTSCTQRILTQWLKSIDGSAEKHGKRLKSGFRETVVNYAIGASKKTDVKALTWLFQLPALVVEKSKIQKFVASMPGDVIIQLLDNSVDQGKTFRHHLSTLFRSCAPGTVGLSEDMRRRRLLVCLTAVHRAAQALIASREPSLSALNDIRLRYADTTRMRPLWADSDPAIRVTARSICALVARLLLRKRRQTPLEAWELTWLQGVMNESTNTIQNACNDSDTVDSMNVDSFVNGVLSYQVEDLPEVQVTFFKETLKVLVNTSDTSEEWLSSLIQRIEQEDGRPDRDNIVAKLRRMLSSTTSGPQSQASDT